MTPTTTTKKKGEPITCPGCGNTDLTLLSRVPSQTPRYVCDVCSADFYVTKEER